MEVSEKFLSLARQSERPIICDIGSRDAMEGLFLLKELDAKLLHVFEPNPDAIVRCRENIGDRRDVILNEIGLSDEIGTAQFFPIDLENSEQKDIGFSSMYEINPAYSKSRQAVRQKPMSIAVTTLDEYFRDKELPDILWIDVEGAELRVLKGAADVLKNVSLIQVELGFREMQIGKPLFWEIDRFLRSQGFKQRAFVEFPNILGSLYRYRLIPNPPWRCNVIYCNRFFAI